MQNAFQHDVGARLSAFAALDSAVITAAAGNDNAAVSGNILDRLDNPDSKSGPAMSLQLLIAVKAVLAANKTLSFAVTIQHGAASNLSDAATYPARRARYVAADGTVTALPLTSGALAAGVVVTDSGSGSTAKGVLMIDIDASSAKQYLRAVVTADLNASGTDTVALGGIFVLGGLVEKPV